MDPLSPLISSTGVVIFSFHWVMKHYFILYKLVVLIFVYFLQAFTFLMNGIRLRMKDLI
jgi:hypothetical protein